MIGFTFKTLKSQVALWEKLPPKSSKNINPSNGGCFLVRFFPLNSSRRSWSVFCVSQLQYLANYLSDHSYQSFYHFFSQRIPVKPSFHTNPESLPTDPPQLDPTASFFGFGQQAPQLVLDDVAQRVTLHAVLARLPGGAESLEQFSSGLGLSRGKIWELERQNTKGCFPCWNAKSQPWGQEHSRSPRPRRFHWSSWGVSAQPLRN